jgi:hypothetical protein
MRKLLLLTFIALSTVGCQTTTTSGPRLLIGPEQAKKIGLQLTGPIGADKAGYVYLAAPANVMRYDPKTNQIEEMLVAPVKDLRGVAVTPEGVVLVLLPQELDAYLAGHLVKIHSLPGQADAVSCDREFAYVLVTTEKGGALLRYHLTGRTKGTLDTLLTTEDRPLALCAVPGGCLVASGGNIVKVTDPVRAPGETEPTVATVLLVALRDKIMSVAVDPGRSYVYFSTDDTTLVWADGQVFPIFPAGYELAWVDDTLTICQPVAGQLIQVGAVSGHVRKILTATAKTKP